MEDKKDYRYNKIDGYTGHNGHFMYPYPINEKEYITSYSATQTRRDSMNGYGIYYVRQDGARELLVDEFLVDKLSGGARLQEGMDTLESYAWLFRSQILGGRDGFYAACRIS